MAAWSAPALLAFAADAGAFSALGGQHVGVARVGVAPAQVVLQAPGQRRMIGVVRITHDEGAQRPELGLDRIRPRGIGWGETQLNVVFRCPATNSGVLLAARLSRTLCGSGCCSGGRRVYARSTG